MPGISIPQDRSDLKQLLTIGNNLLESVPSNDLNEEALTSFPVYGSIIHLLQQWIQRYESLSPRVQKEVATLLPPKLLFEAKHETLSQDKDLVAAFVTKSLPLLLPVLQKFLNETPMVDQVEE
jgi:hypothetical protein